MKKTRPLKVFYSYSHNDMEYRKSLGDHLSLLRHTKIIEDWHDGCLVPGEEWEPEIAKYLDEADIILLLISSSFMASRYCYSIEMKRAIQRHESGDAIVIPILIRPVDWSNATFGKLQCLPPDAKPMSKWDDQDEGFREVSLGIRKTIEKFLKDGPRSHAQDMKFERTGRASIHVGSPQDRQYTYPKGSTSIIGSKDNQEQLRIREVSTSRVRSPLVSWLMVTTLTKHRWWKRLGEFLSENFLPNEIEFIILGAQDLDFADRAYEEGKKIASAYAFLEGAEERWENVVFVDAYQPEFNLYKAINILTSLARGDILIYRDADCLLLQYRFTQYMVETLLKTQLGVLSVPSLSNGHPFKPKDTDIVLSRPEYPGILLDSTVNGMAVAVLKEVEEAIGGRNESTPLLQYTNYCAKMAQMGLLMGYAVDRGFWLATADGESTITRTDITKDPTLIKQKQIAFSMINRFYNIKEDDILGKLIKERYNICLQEMDQQLKDDANKLYPEYVKSQNLEPKLKRYDFKPWECLSHQRTEQYILEARNVAKPLFDPVIQKAKSLKSFEGA